LTKERYKELFERNSNKFMLCFEYFCEISAETQKKKIEFSQFQQLFPQWLITMQPDVFVMSGADIREVTDVSVAKIVEYLNKKYEY
jgi:hypothetical protein